MCVFCKEKARARSIPRTRSCYLSGWRDRKHSETTQTMLLETYNNEFTQWGLEACVFQWPLLPTWAWFEYLSRVIRGNSGGRSRCTPKAFNIFGMSTENRFLTPHETHIPLKTTIILEYCCWVVLFLWWGNILAKERSYWTSISPQISDL